MGGFLLLGLLGGLLPVAVLVLVVVVVIGGRHEPDPARERPIAVYLSAACFFAVFAALAGAGLVADGIVQLAHDKSDESALRMPGVGRVQIQLAAQADDESDFSTGDESSFEEFSSFDTSGDVNGDISMIVSGGILLLLAAGVFAFHEPKLRTEVASSAGPGARVFAKASYVTCFIAMLAVVGSLASLGMNIYAAIVPRVADAGTRAESFRGMVGPAVVAAGALWIFGYYWRRGSALSE